MPQAVFSNEVYTKSICTSHLTCSPHVTAAPPSEGRGLHPLPWGFLGPQPMQRLRSLPIRVIKCLHFLPGKHTLLSLSLSLILKKKYIHSHAIHIGERERFITVLGSHVVGSGSASPGLQGQPSDRTLRQELALHGNFFSTLRETSVLLLRPFNELDQPPQKLSRIIAFR